VGENSGQKEFITEYANAAPPPKHTEAANSQAISEVRFPTSDLIYQRHSREPQQMGVAIAAIRGPEAWRSRICRQQTFQCVRDLAHSLPLCVNTKRQSRPQRRADNRYANETLSLANNAAQAVTISRPRPSRFRHSRKTPI